MVAISTDDFFYPENYRVNSGFNHTSLKACTFVMIGRKTLSIIMFSFKVLPPLWAPSRDESQLKFVLHARLGPQLLATAPLAKITATSSLTRRSCVIEKPIQWDKIKCLFLISSIQGQVFVSLSHSMWSPMQSNKYVVFLYMYSTFTMSSQKSAWHLKAVVCIPRTLMTSGGTLRIKGCAGFWLLESEICSEQISTWLWIWRWCNEREFHVAKSKTYEPLPCFFHTLCSPSLWLSNINELILTRSVTHVAYQAFALLFFLSLSSSKISWSGIFLFQNCIFKAQCRISRMDFFEVQESVLHYINARSTNDYASAASPFSLFGSPSSVMRLASPSPPILHLNCKLPWNLPRIEWHKLLWSFYISKTS